MAPQQHPDLLSSPLIGENESEIASFYRGRSVFITGATGFMGKVLVEKMLRSCPELDTMYLLMRAKKNQHIHERTDKLLADEVFQRLTKAQLAKVVPVAGDISMLGLGISPEARKLLCERVSVVFHSAATVRFADSIRDTLITNLRGTREVVALCREMPLLRTLVYTSTAYAHCVRREIGETLYPTAHSYEHVLKLVETLNEKQIQDMSATLMVGWPNCYTFSKALAEHLVKDNMDLPVVIFKPSMVVSTLQEPLPGWNDNLNGPSGVVVGSAMGVVRCFVCDLRVRVDLVPCDLAVNAMIASAWHIAENKRETTVYNFTSGARNPVYWRQFQDLIYKHGLKAPPVQAIWFFSLLAVRSVAMFRFAAFFLHTIPALLMDGVALCMGKKRRMFKLYKKIDTYVEVAEWFSVRQWSFDDSNVQALIGRMTPSDRELFPCDVTSFDWDSYFNIYYLGVRKFMLKDDPSTVPAALVRYNKLYWIHMAVKGMLTAAAFYILSRLAFAFFVNYQ